MSRTWQVSVYLKHLKSFLNNIQNFDMMKNRYICRRIYAYFQRVFTNSWFMICLIVYPVRPKGPSIFILNFNLIQNTYYAFHTYYAYFQRVFTNSWFMICLSPKAYKGPSIFIQNWKYVLRISHVSRIFPWSNFTILKFCQKCILHSKGQLISKCPFGVIVWTKIPTKFFPGFLP